MSELRRAVLSGLTWQSAGAAASQGISLVLAVLLARLLSPAEFGLVAMVTVITGFASVFARLGLGAALVQAPDLDEEQISSAFWLNVAAGCGVTLLVMALAPLVGAFYSEPSLVALTLVLALEFALAGPAITQHALCRRELRFRRLALIEGTATGVSGLLALALALSGFGVWSLVARSLLASVTRTGLFLVMSDRRPRAVFRWGAVRGLLPFGGSLMGTETLHYWTRNLDSLLVGRFIGVEALGFYNRANRLLLAPLASGTRVARSVLFPSLTRIKDDPLRVKVAFLRTSRTLALLSFPVYLGALATLDTAVPWVLGPLWAPIIPIGRVFCALGIVQSMAGLNGSLYLAMGRADLQLRYGLLLRLNTIVAICIGLQWGALGVASCYAAASLVNYYPNTRVAGGLIGMRVGEVVAGLRGVFLCAAAAAAGMWGAGLACAGGPPDWAVFVIQAGTGITLYAALLRVFRVRALVDLSDAAREQLAPREAIPGTAG